MSNSSLRILLGLLVTIAAVLITQTVCAQAAVPTPTPVITFTEINDTTLTAVYTNGAGVSTNLTVTPTAPGATDSWSVAGTATLIPTGIASWFEPSSTSSFNTVNGVALGGPWLVLSDLTTACPFCVANNTMSPNIIATDTTTASSVYGIFNDLGDAPAGVPDTGTTASLLGFSLAGLAFLRRKLA